MVIGNSFVIQHFADTVWAIKPERLKIMSEVITEKFLNRGEIPKSLNLVKDSITDDQPEFIQRLNNGTAILNIEGTLVPKASWLDSLCGMVSTLELTSQFEDLVEDYSVNKIVLYFDSPGGSVTGIPEFAAKINEARSKKKIIAFTDNCMCSGAYYLASAASKIIATPTADVGSIGVYSTIYKQKPDSSLYDTYFIQAGTNKVYGNTVTPLTESEAQYFQTKVNNIYEMFTGDVAVYRRTSIENVKATQGSYYGAGIDNTPKWMIDTLADANYILSQEV